MTQLWNSDHFLLIFIISSLFNCAYADDDITYQLNIQHVPHGGTHVEHYIPIDQPDVYMDTSNAVIIIDGGGEVTYYDVQITSMTTWYVVISTMVSGTYDTIDVSSLAAGDYIITISSPTGNEFEGEFTIN